MKKSFLLKMAGCAVIAHLAFLNPFIRPASAQEAARYGLKIGRAACAYMEAGIPYNQAIGIAIDDSWNEIWKSGVNRSTISGFAAAYIRQTCKKTAIKMGAEFDTPDSGKNCFNYIIVGSRKACI